MTAGRKAGRGESGVSGGGPRALCPMVRAVNSISGKWALAVVYYLMEEPKTFSQLKRLLGVSSKTLALTLRRLEGEGIVEKGLVYPPLRIQYRLTGKGRALKPVIEALEEWASREAEA